MPKKGGTPHRNDIVFISPTGEEVKNKRQLDIYLRSHPGNPSSSEFDWGTGLSLSHACLLTYRPPLPCICISFAYMFANVIPFSFLF